jgi:hypothetical protein
MGRQHARGEGRDHELRRDAMTGQRLARITKVVAHVNWGIIDQGVLSLTSFALALLVVRSVPAADFGSFSLVVVLYVLTLGVVRAVNTEALTIRFGGDATAVRRVAPQSLGLAAAAGLTLAAATVAIAVSVGGTLGSVLAVLAATYPFLLMQDTARFIAFAMSRPRLAALNDVAWAMGSALVIAGLLFLPTSEPSLWHYVAAWLVPGGLVGVLATWRLRMWPNLLAAGAWLRGNRHLNLPLVVVYVLTAAPPYLLFALAPLVTGLAELGHARAGFIPFGVFGVVLQTALILLLPFAAQKPVDGVWRIAKVSSLGLSAVAALWSLLVVVLTPDALGTFLMGPEWTATRDIQVMFAFAVVAQALAVGPQIALRALEQPGRLVGVRIVTAPLILGGGLFLAAHGGGVGLTAATLVGDVSTAILGWLQLWRFIPRCRRANS